MKGQKGQKGADIGGRIDASYEGRCRLLQIQHEKICYLGTKMIRKREPSPPASGTPDECQ